jgi:3-phosphoshikimate 1-carboxyvinyltransferase
MNNLLTITVPGDKSITHRAIMLGAIAHGETKIINPLLGEDCKATLRAIKQLGIKTLFKNNILYIYGHGKQGLKYSNQAIDCGNSGTTMRLFAGILAAQPFETHLIGDHSLSKRPMDRIINPLAAMGASIKSNYGFAPLTIDPVIELHSAKHKLAIASSQIKSCILLAGLYAKGTTIIHQPIQTRDHTERMLKQFNYPLIRNSKQIIINNNYKLIATTIDVPGDFSSAAFFIVAALIIPNKKILIKNVGINPTRTGLINLLRLMGARISISNIQNNSEPRADILVKTSPLNAINVPQNLIANAIDEFPIFFIAAAHAQGTTTLNNAKELTFKESNRIATMAYGLRNIGINCNFSNDSISITGGVIQGGVVDARHDHRVAMAFVIANGIAKNRVILQNSTEINTSFPTFYDTCRVIGLNINE